MGFTVLKVALENKYDFSHVSPQLNSLDPDELQKVIFTFIKLDIKNKNPDVAGHPIWDEWIKKSQLETEKTVSSFVKNWYSMKKEHLAIEIKNIWSCLNKINDF